MNNREKVDEVENYWDKKNLRIIFPFKQWNPPDNHILSNNFNLIKDVKMSKV